MIISLDFYHILSYHYLKNDFYGYVEGDDITKGTVDIVVTDGFTGNITLKAIEGTVKLVTNVIKEGFSDSIWSKIGYILASASINKAKKTMDPRLHNGAMLVGLNGVVVKSHGGTDKVGFANAIKVAISLVEHKINEQIMGIHTPQGTPPLEPSNPSLNKSAASGSL